MSKVVVMDHPLIEQKIGIIRRKETGTKDFRQNISEIAMLIGYEATKDLKLEEVEIETPICKTTVKQLKGKKLALVPILRAGLGMVDGMLSLIPAAKVGHIGLYRDPETLKPIEYYCKLPADCAEREVFVVDPMLATGGSSIAAIQLLKDKGCKSIRLLCIIAAPEGVKAMQEAHPDVDDYISWDEYFMGVAHLSGMRSKDPNTQVGACIVSPDNKILSMGYNGFPKGCSDDEFPWERENDKDSNLTKYPFVTHSELNAILNYRGGSLEGTKLYVSLFPCNECAKAIIQAGIHTVVYDSDKYRGTPSNRAARRMFDAAGVECVPYSRTGRTIHIGV